MAKKNSNNGMANKMKEEEVANMQTRKRIVNLFNFFYAMSKSQSYIPRNCEKELKTNEKEKHNRKL